MIHVAARSGPTERTIPTDPDTSERSGVLATGAETPVRQAGGMGAVRLATMADHGRVARTATRAFADDPLFRWFFPEAAAYEAAAPEMFGSLATKSISLGCTWVTSDAVAIGMYLPPGRPEPPGVEEEAPADDVPDLSSLPPELLAKFGAIGEAMAANTPPELHWYLHVLATHPDWQRQGLGASIIAPVAERCDAEGLPLYLETQTASNVAYYGHLGFAVRTEWDLPFDGPHMWGMIREPAHPH